MDEALDNDIFLASTTRVQSAELAHRHLRVFQNDAPSPSLNDLVSRSEAPVAAIVERDADIQAAARALILARFGLRGGSPYAPDIVFVNEWVKKDFLLAVTQAAVGFLDNTERLQSATDRGFLDEVAKKKAASVISVGKGVVVLDIEDR